MSFKNRIIGKFRDNHKFTFSIIIAVYNAEKYLGETIESILNQSFDSSKVQVILVDDGSSDESGRICMKYKETHPDNFIYVRQENQGQSIARNNGLDYAEGKFVNFLDSDDILERNVLKEVNDGFRKWGNDIDVVAIPRYAFGRDSYPLPFYDKYRDARVVDITKEYDFPQVSASASFVRADAIKEKFNPELVISEDSLFLNRIILEKRRFGVVPARYLYRKREDEDSTIDTRKTQKAYFSKRIELYLKELILLSEDMYGEVLKYVQSVAVHDLHWLMIQNSEIGVLDAEETQDYYADIRDVLQHIDDDVILSQNYRKSLKYHILSEKYGDYDYDIKDDFLQFKSRDYDRLANYMIFVEDVSVNENKADIRFYFEFYPVDFSLTAYTDGNAYDLDCCDVDETISMGRTVLGKYFYSISIAIGKGVNEISFVRKMNDAEYDVRVKNEADMNEHVKFDDYKITIGR